MFKKSENLVLLQLMGAFASILSLILFILAAIDVPIKSTKIFGAIIFAALAATISLIMTKRKFSKESVNYKSNRKQIFISYVREDKDKALYLYNKLKEAGLQPWIDIKNLMPGQRWETEIKNAIVNSKFLILALSKESIMKKGYIQKELKLALDISDEMPESEIFIIPIRFDDVEVPSRLSAFQWVDLYEKDGINRLIKTIKTK